jgi:hypothetical protein
MEIYISRSGERYGPYSLAEVQADIDGGRIQPTDLAWHEGVADWAEVWQIDGIVLPKRRVPPPPPPASAARAAYYPSVPQKSSSGGEMALLIIVTILLPIVGIIVGIIRLASPERRGEGGALLAIAIVIMIFWMIVFSL